MAYAYLASWAPKSSLYDDIFAENIDKPKECFLFGMHEFVILDQDLLVWYVETHLD